MSDLIEKPALSRRSLFRGLLGFAALASVGGAALLAPAPAEAAPVPAPVPAPAAPNDMARDSDLPKAEPTQYYRRRRVVRHRRRVMRRRVIRRSRRRMMMR